MEKLYYYRQVLRRFYAEYGNYLEMAAKACVMLAALLVLNRCFGTVSLLARPITIAGLCLLVSVLPWGFLTFLAAGAALAELVFFSPEAAVIFFTALIALCVLRYLTLPEASVVMVILPVLLYWKVPYAVPILVGLTAPFSGFVSVAGGTVIYALLALFVRSGAYLQAEDTGTFVQHLLYLVKSAASDRTMFLQLLCFCLTALVVWLILRLSVDYVEYIAIGVGALLQIVILLLGSRTLGVETDLTMLLLGSFLAVVLAVLCVFFRKALDYRRKERVRFEDDEYVYYVKAVPRVVVPERAPSDTDVFSAADHALILEAIRAAAAGGAEKKTETEEQ